MYLNYIEETFMLNGYEGANVVILKLCLLLYADILMIFAESESSLQNCFVSQGQIVWEIWEWG